MSRVAIGIILIGLGGPAWAADPQVLESDLLRVEVTAEPYGYRVVEKATGEVLVSQSGTTFQIEEAPPDAGAGAGDQPDGGIPDGGDDAAPALPTLRVVRALRAVTVEASGGSLQAELALDGIAETARATFTFATPEILEVQVALPGRTVRNVGEELDDRQEHVYGIWEYPFGGNLDNRGTEADYLGVRTNPGVNFSSGRAPFYVTSRRYGVYVRSSARGHYRVAIGGKTSFSFDEPALRYDVIYGPSYDQVLARYTALAGAPLMMPPLWAMGAIWWSDDFHRDLRAGVATPQEAVLDLARQLRAHQIPASGLLIDRPFGTGFNGWGNMDFDPGFPDPPAMVSGLHDLGLELMVWIANRSWSGLYPEGSAQGFLFPGDANLGPAVDVRNPAAYGWMQRKLDAFVSLGVKGYKIDRGEEREQPEAVQNENVTLFARLAQEGLAARHGDQAFMFTRNVADIGRRYTAVWNGDSAADFTGLAYSMTSGLRSGVIVMPMWGSDTGGYLRGGGRLGGPNEEVFARWFGLGAWSPMMEVLVGAGHTPWYDYSQALVEIARKHAETHHDLIPYTRSFLSAATRTGAPVMRPLVFSYPDDPMLANRSDEYLYGSELLVAPVITAGAQSRSVYLPAASSPSKERWLDYNDRQTVFAAGSTVTVAAPLATVPVLVREGAIVPRGRLLRANDDWTPGWAPALRIEVFPAETDMTRRFDYETGAGVEAITARTEGRKVTVSFGDLTVPGTVELQLAAPGTVSRNGSRLVAGKDYQYDPAARRLSVPFQGATELVVDGAVSVFAPAPAPPPPGESGCHCALTTRGRPPVLATFVVIGFALARTRRRRRL
jgi:alpha-D-xyloside xylohydrolase